MKMLIMISKKILNDPNVFGTNTLVDFLGESIFELKNQGQNSGYIVKIDESHEFGSEIIGNIKLSVIDGKMLIIRNENGSELVGKFLAIQPTDNVDHEIFFSFIRSFLEQFENCDNVKEIHELIVNRYEIWKAFFGGVGRSKPSVQKCIGLLGELIFLAEVTKFDKKNALNSWTGPFRTHHDFYFSNCSFEIKSSLNLASSHIQVNGIDQLESPSNSQLFLMILKLIPDDDGNSIASLIDNLLSSGLDKKLLFEKLSRLNITEENYNLFSDLKVSLNSIRRYEIDSKFPILNLSATRSEYIDRISNINYTLDLSGINHERDFGITDLEMFN
jgi:hypothetical protein